MPAQNEYIIKFRNIYSKNDLCEWQKVALLFHLREIISSIKLIYRKWMQTKIELQSEWGSLNDWRRRSDERIRHNKSINGTIVCYEFLEVGFFVELGRNAVDISREIPVGKPSIKRQHEEKKTRGELMGQTRNSRTSKFYKFQSLLKRERERNK